MMDAEVATRRLRVMHSHVLGLNRQEYSHSDIAMQACAASSAVGYARPAACGSQHGRACHSEGKGRHEEAALRAAEHVLGSTLVPVKGHAAAEAPPAFARAAGDDARVLQAVAEAHAAFERSLICSSKQEAPKAAAAVSRSTRRGIGLRVNALQSSTCHTLQLALPGVRPEDLRVEINGRQLTISGQRPVIPVHSRAAPVVHRTEQGLTPKQKRTSFSSTWRLPADADSRRASAELDNGVLRVSFWRTS